ncbi:MAG: Ig-like domain-containing protein [Nitrospiraceae bacterium]
MDRPTPPAAEGTPGPASTNHAPSVQSATIQPNPIVLSGSVSVHAEGTDPDGDRLSFRYQWLANGRPIVGEAGPTLIPRMLRRGDKVSVEVIPTDGKVEGPLYRSDEVPVGNTLPVVNQVVLEPGLIRVGDRVVAKVEGDDLDHDDIRYTFRWWRNQSLVSEGDHRALETTGFARGDTILVEVTPHDSGNGKSRFSEMATIGNSAPRITSMPATVLAQGRYEYIVTGADPDGDPLIFSLQAAPPGMTIDSKTGRIEWRIAADVKGTHRTRVVVEDGHGGQAFQDFELNLPPPTS